MWRVVYGETMRAWERLFLTRDEAKHFARKQRSLGDIVFSVRKVVKGEPPQSMMAAIEADMACKS